jgi:prolyl oligopeptidase
LLVASIPSNPEFYLMRRLFCALLILVTPAAVMADTTPTRTTALPPAPIARMADVSENLHGTTITDPYRWLEDPDSTETRAWVDAQNRRTEAYFDAGPERDTFRARISEVLNYERMGKPSKEGGQYFYTRTTGLENQEPVYRRRSLDGPEELVIDPNTLSADGTVAITGYSVSEDGRYFAYMTASGGSDWNEARILDLETSKTLDDHLKWLKFTGLAWLHDGSGFFYGRYPEPAGGDASRLTETNYDFEVRFHRLGTPQSADALVYKRPDDRELGFYPVVTDDGKYLVLPIWRGTEPKTGLAYAELSGGVPETTTVRVLIEHGEADYAFIGNEGRTFFFITDNAAPRKRIIAVDLDRPQREHWREIVPQGTDTIEDATLAGGQIIVTTLHDACHRVTRYDLAGRRLGEIPLPGLGTTTGFSARPRDKEAFFDFTSYVTPLTIFRYDITADRVETVFRPKVAINLDDFLTTQVFATSRDGTRIPLFITHRRGLVLDGSAPARLHAYGGFRVSTTPSFSTSNLTWLERGGIYAEAVIRGGGEYGAPWHDDGRLLNKTNSFEDFEAAARWLVENRYTAPQRLGIEGGSNGGLLVGACITRNPALFGAAVAEVGVFDMLRFHRYTIGWAWVPEYGSPDDPVHFRYLLGYSPLHNVRPGTHYPALLLMTGDHDDRVVPAHSYKFAAAMQKAQAGPRPILLAVDTKAGHGAGKPLDKIIEERAMLMAFFARELGLAEKQPKP